ncbi:MAG: helix-turn-helix domain-containing protein [Xanthobacteraceae bacterium]|nr:helix-turn-helix domain-containing protein [Xanthobacteraceae bacterium]MBV9627518.1 helix-turn-helix domain-containing protein [Xanthobacteraceae bacterium]
MMKRWSSSDVAVRERLNFWVDAVCRNLVQLRCEPLRDQPFFGEIGYDEFGPLKLVRVQSVAQRVSRTSKDTTSDAATEFYHVNIMQGGRGSMSQNGRQTGVGSGGFVFSDSNQPYSIDFTENFSSNVLRIPRSMLLQRIRAPESYTAMRVDGATGLGGMVTLLLRELPLNQQAIPSFLQARVAENVVDLIAAALISTQDAAALPTRVTLTRVKFWIETHLVEDLTAERISTGCRLSVRHLNRLFAREDTSVMRYVWDRRLARAHRDLTDPMSCYRSISDLAYSAGFTDTSHFSRAYRARYGKAPSEARDGVSGPSDTPCRRDQASGARSHSETMHRHR